MVGRRAAVALELEEEGWEACYHRSPARRRESALRVVAEDPEREPVEVDWGADGCPVCGDPLTQTTRGATRKYCSKVCQRAARQGTDNRGVSYVAGMTEAEAEEILEQGFGTTGTTGMLRVHEALLVKNGVPKAERAAILRNIAAAYGFGAG